MAGIPDGYKDILQKKAFADLATVDADGAPQVTPGLDRLRRYPHPVQHREGAGEGPRTSTQPVVALSIHGSGQPLPLRPGAGAGRRDHRGGRRRAHRRARQEVPRAGQVSLPQARRGAGHLQDHSPSGPDAWGRRPGDPLEGVSKGYGGQHPPPRRHVADRRARAHRPRRAERRRQDHALPHPRRRGGARRRAGEPSHAG